MIVFVFISRVQINVWVFLLELNTIDQERYTLQQEMTFNFIYFHKNSHQASCIVS